ncbi:MAG: phasin [Rhodomicrobium sp.]|jgi:phasin
MNQPMDFEIPATVRDLASKSVDQAREAYNRFLEAARQAHDVVTKSTDVITSGAREINEKAVRYTEANLQANFDLAQRLVHAKDLKEALDIQSQFARQQMETFAHQAQELTRLVAQSAQKAAPTGLDE